MVEFADVDFPLPLRDPRGYSRSAANNIQVAQATLIDVPLPRRRPGSVAPTVTAQPSEAGDRVIQFGNKSVRIVGPDTPYAQVKAAGP